MKLIFIHGSGGCRVSWQHPTEYFKNSEAIILPGHPAEISVRQSKNIQNGLKHTFMTKGVLMSWGLAINKPVPSRHCRRKWHHDAA